MTATSNWSVDDRRDCLHPKARHRHGTRAAYIADRCRCQACTAANGEVITQRAKAIAVGVWQPYMAAQPVRDHIQALRDAGTGIAQIANLTGVPVSTLRRLVYETARPEGRIRTITATSILQLSVGPDTRSHHSTVDAAETRVRIQILLAAGWTLPTLARLLGRTPQSLRRTTQRTAVTVNTAVAMNDLYNRLKHRRRPTPRPQIAGPHARATVAKKRSHSSL